MKHSQLSWTTEPIFSSRSKEVHGSSSLRLAAYVADALSQQCIQKDLITPHWIVTIVEFHGPKLLCRK
jgi:hypothetical protein